MRTRLDLLLDAALAALVTAVGLAEIWVPFDSRQGSGSEVAVSAVVVGSGLALSQRRRHPLATGLVVLWGWPVVFVVEPLPVLFFGQFVPMAIALFSMARHGRGRVPVIGAAAGAATLLFFDLVVTVLQSPGEVVFHWGVFTIVWSFGWAIQRFERRAVESTRRAVEVEVAAAEQALAAIMDERARIARELHDVVAHSVSLMVVQAGAAEQVVGEDPEEVRRALAAIRGTGSEALSEMRRLVTVLREHDEPGSREPQPGLAGVPALIEELRAAGVEAHLSVVGEPPALPAGLDLAAYRIVQEALTNVRRHAAAARVDVEVRYDAHELRLEVRDDGSGCAEPRGGHGLVGMRERAALYGGRLDLSSGPGFAVRAVLPVGGAS